MIEHVRIKNFRSLVDVAVDLSPVTVLIGRSGTGKSNFVRAIRFLRDSLNLRAVVFNAGHINSLHVDHVEEPLEFEIRFTIAALESQFVYLLGFDPKTQTYTERLSKEKKTLFHHADRKWIVAPDVVSVPAPHGILLGAIPGLQDSTFAYIALRSHIGCYDFPGEVVAGSENTVPQRDLLALRGMVSSETDSKFVLNSPDNGFADRGENYLVVADRILGDLNLVKRWNRIVKCLKVLNTAVKSLTPNVPNRERIDVGYTVNGRVLTLDVRNESEGFRRFFAHLLALYQTPSKGTLLFEHPESGLHPAALQALADEFKRCPEENRGQIILTTHSPQLLDYFPVESIRVVQIENHATQIGLLAPEQLSSVRDHLIFPGELLTVDPARMSDRLETVSG